MHSSRISRNQSCHLIKEIKETHTKQFSVLQSNLSRDEYAYTDDTIVLEVIKWKHFLYLIF